ncbi:Uncharacterised protein [Prevotella melaninogenica]|nr:Uncharacterised protein [Prevotella melaninogenica]
MITPKGILIMSMRIFITKRPSKWLKVWLKTSILYTLISLLLSSTCKGSFQEVLSWTSKGR